MSNTKNAAGAHVPCIDLLACPFCGHSFDRSSIKKSYLGEVWDQYTCPGCELSSPKLRCGGCLEDWWNTRANNTATETQPNGRPFTWE